MNKLSGIGSISRERLSKMLNASDGIISVSSASLALNIGKTESAKILSRLSKKGWLQRIKRGLYVSIPIESQSSERIYDEPWAVANKIYAPCYIGGWSAAEYWDLTEQIFNTTVVITEKRITRKEINISGLNFYLKHREKIKDFGLDVIWKSTNKILVSNPTRLIIDLLDDVKLGGGIRPIMDICKAYLNSKYVNQQLLLDYANLYKNGSIYKRLGFLLELILGKDNETVKACLKNLSKGTTKLDPSLICNKPITKWKIWIPDNWYNDYFL